MECITSLPTEKLNNTHTHTHVNQCTRMEEMRTPTTNYKAGGRQGGLKINSSTFLVNIIVNGLHS